MQSFRKFLYIKYLWRAPRRNPLIINDLWRLELGKLISCMIEMHGAYADNLNTTGAVELILPKGNVVFEFDDFCLFIHNFILTRYHRFGQMSNFILLFFAFSWQDKCKEDSFSFG